MDFFRAYFGENMSEEGETAVKCPFPHTDEQGNHYFETVPSAHINIERSIYHCKVCGRGMSEVTFLAKLQNLSYKDALIVLSQMKDSKGDEWTPYRTNYLNSEKSQGLAHLLGFSSVADALELGYDGKEGLSFPVKIFGQLLDVRTYRPNKDPKVLSKASPGRKGPKTLMLPFDLWVNDRRPTLLCAGEKDMAIARAKGFNAITFTGGEQAFPKLWKASFKGRHVYIVYDNDQAGHEGAMKVAALLKEAGSIPYVVTKHYEVCREKGEDLWDFFMKYGGNIDDFKKILTQTDEFSAEDYVREREKFLPLITLSEVGNGKHVRGLVSSRVTVSSIFEEVFQTPEYVEFLKHTLVGDDSMDIKETRVWALGEDNLQDVLKLVDSKLKEGQIIANLKQLAGIPAKEGGIRIYVKSKVPIFKAIVSDDSEGEVFDEKSTETRELLVYSIGQPLSSGSKYRMIYKACPHPFEGGKMVAMISSLEESDNSVNRFELTDTVKESMACFRVENGQTVSEKMDEIYERMKGFAKAETRKEIAFATELFFHTPLHFNFGPERMNEKGLLDIMIVGDSRTGKSQAAKAMIQQYELGVIASLKTTTVGALIGGSDSSSGGWKTKIGLLPRNHKGAVILEEFSAGKDFISQLTEIRSSGMVRLGRVSGMLNVPAKVRMLAISNPASKSGLSLPMAQYPHGMAVLLDLIGSSADINRYDFFTLVDDPEGYTSPLTKISLPAFPKDSYMNRIRWIWTRTAEQVILNQEVLELIVDTANELNNEYDMHIKLFGPEAWKKLSRVAIAVAGILCNTDETGEKLVVNKFHVEWAKNFLIGCYDNPLFKLKPYVLAERRFTECDEGAILVLQDLYTNHSTMLHEFLNSTGMHTRQLADISGLDYKEYSKVMNTMSQAAFFRRTGDKFIPSIRFRKAMEHVVANGADKTYMQKLGIGVGSL